MQYTEPPGRGAGEGEAADAGDVARRRSRGAWRRLSGRRTGTMLGAMLGWWAARLRELLPARLRAGAMPPDALLVTLRGDGEAEFALRRRGREAPLGRFALDPGALAGLPAALRRR